MTLGNILIYEGGFVFIPVHKSVVFFLILAGAWTGCQRPPYTDLEEYAISRRARYHIQFLPNKKPDPNDDTSSSPSTLSW